VSVTEAAQGRVDVARARLRNTWPLIGVGLAVIVNAAWIGLLGYGVSRHSSFASRFTAGASGSRLD